MLSQSATKVTSKGSHNKFTYKKALIGCTSGNLQEIYTRCVHVLDKPNNVIKIRFVQLQQLYRNTLQSSGDLQVRLDDMNILLGPFFFTLLN